MVWILFLVNMRKRRRRNKVLVSQNLFVWSWLCETRTFLEAGGAKYLLETLCKLFAYSTLFHYHAGKWWAVFREFYTHIHLDLEDGSKRSRVIGLQLCFGFLLQLLNEIFTLFLLMTFQILCIKRLNKFFERLIRTCFIITISQFHNPFAFAVTHYYKKSVFYVFK